MDRDALAREMCAQRYPTSAADYPDFFDQLAPESQERWRDMAGIALAYAERRVAAASEAMRERAIRECYELEDRVNSMQGKATARLAAKAIRSLPATGDW